MNFAGQCGHNLFCGNTGILPLCERILETVPSFLSSTGCQFAGCGVLSVVIVGNNDQRVKSRGKERMRPGDDGSTRTRNKS